MRPYDQTGDPALCLLVNRVHYPATLSRRRWKNKKKKIIQFIVWGMYNGCYPILHFILGWYFWSKAIEEKIKAGWIKETLTER
jgi:hypothetical protein